jgi:hypothetical protein
MRKNRYKTISKSVLIVFSTLISNTLLAQQQKSPKSRGDFWQNVQFGGGVGLGFGSNYTDISLAPSAIYNFNEYVALGLESIYLPKTKKLLCFPLLWWQYYRFIQSHTCNPTFC